MLCRCVIAAGVPISPDHILQTGFAFWSSKTLLSAVEMGLFSDLRFAVPSDLAHSCPS